MSEVLLKALSFIVVIAIGYSFKRLGFFSKNDASLITKTALNITLPAAVITSFSNFEKDGALFSLIAIGLIVDIIFMSIGFLISFRKNRLIRTHYIFNLTGYNIGSFTMPFVQGFLGGYGVIATCMFDMGNAMMCSGGTYISILAALGSGGGAKLGFKDILKKLLSSVPFDIYMLMLIFAFLNIHIPKPVVTITSTIASANGFMAMLMLGLMLELDIKWEYLKEVIKVLFIRYALSGVLAWIVFFYSPFSLVIRQVLTLILFSPSSALIPAFTKMLNADEAMASFSGSLSIVCSVIIMTVMMVVLNV